MLTASDGAPDEDNMATITDADRAEALDVGVAPELIAAVHEAKVLEAEAWLAFCAYVEQPGHDIRSDEFARGKAAHDAATAAYDAAEHAVVLAMPV
jgi:hypothetical protein